MHTSLFSSCTHFEEIYITDLAPDATLPERLPILHMAKIRTQRHVVREKARKRTKNLFKKANELAKIADANVYVVIDRSGKFQVYKSTDTPGWPPSEQEIVSNQAV